MPNQVGGGLKTYYAILPGAQQRRTTIGSYPDIPRVSTLMSGELVSAPVAEPLAFELSAQLPGDRQHLYLGHMPLMSNRLVALLRDCGVDNLQCFRAVLRDPTTGVTWDDYQAVNIVGAVACVDFEKSDFQGGDRLVTATFDGFAIDPALAGDQKFFRLAESIGTIIARQDVMEFIQAKEPSAVTFVPTVDYAT